MSAFLEFLHMGGYGFYVWGAYGCMFALLLTQWFYPWRRWKNYLRKQTNHHE